MVSLEEPCSLRLSFADSEERNPEPVWEDDTARVSGGAKAYPTGETAKALPYMGATGLWLNERGKLILSAKAETADTVESEESGGSIPVILKSKATGEIYHKILRVGDAGGDFTDFNATDDIVLNVTHFSRLGAYTVPDGYLLTLDATRQVHCYIGDDTA
jgi:hypothetical protein